MLSHVATGIGALQRPLQGLYFHTMTVSAGDHLKLPLRRVSISERGVLISGLISPKKTDDALTGDSSAVDKVVPSAVVSDVTSEEQRLRQMTSELSSSDGGRVEPVDGGEEVLHEMSAVLFWDAVQFVAVRGEDKKLRFAFEPLDNDRSRNNRNLFTLLDTQFHWLVTAYMLRNTLSYIQHLGYIISHETDIIN